MYVSHATVVCSGFMLGLPDGRSAGGHPPVIIVIEFEVTVAGLAQVKEELMTHVMISPPVKLLVENIGLLVPVLTPFIFH